MVDDDDDNDVMGAPVAVAAAAATALAELVAEAGVTTAAAVLEVAASFHSVKYSGGFTSLMFVGVWL